MEKTQLSPTTKLWGWGIGIFLSLILLLILNPFVTIRASERGILLNFGAASDQILEPGLHFRLPIQQGVKKVSIQPIQLDNKVEVGPGGSITRDNQTIGADLTVFYKYKPDQIVNMYKNYGEDKMKAIITQTLSQSFKTEIGNYVIFDLPISQTKIQSAVYQSVVAAMKEYPVEITELKVVNYDWSNEFDKQIAETMNRSQQVKQKEQEKLMAEQEAGKGIVQAEAQKKIAITTAEGQKAAAITAAEGEKASAALRADAKALEGVGIEKYNKSVATNWDIELQKIKLQIEMKKWGEKWNGVFVPNNMYGPIPVDTAGGIKQ